MPQYHKITLSYNAGELSPFLNSRTDVGKYESGCQLLENFIILPYGGVIRRPGTQFLGVAKHADKSCRLIGFNFSTTTNFILEFGDRYIRFWTEGARVNFPDLLIADPAKWVTNANYSQGQYVRNSGTKYRCLKSHESGTFATDLSSGFWVSVQPTALAAWVTAHAYAVGDRVLQGGDDYECKIAHTSAAAFSTDLDAGRWEQIYRAQQSGILELTTPYLEKDIRTIQYTQINDVMYLTHPNYPAAKLTRRADAQWIYNSIQFKWPPMQDENITNLKITPSATTGNITLTASDDLFTRDDVGSIWQIGHNKAGANETWSEVALGTTSASSAQIRVRGPWSLTTYGTWSGEIRIHRISKRTGVDEVIRTYHNTTDGQRNVSTTGNEDEDCVMYIQFITGGTAGSSNPLARLEFSNARVYGLVKITSYTSTTVVNGSVKWDMSEATATIYWSKPAFSAEQGYPRTVCLHDQRLIFGGTKKRPLSLHGSQIDDFENFQRGSSADQAFFFNIAANESNPIQWMVSQTKLLLGTAGDEWAVASAKEDEALGPGNVQAKQQSSFGSAYLQARVVNEVVLYAQRQSRKIRELTYSFEKDGWVSPDLTILAAHIADTGFMETAFCQQPDAIFWSVTRSGKLIGMTYERDQNVVGWHRHSTQGTFESVASIYGGESADELWLSVKRTVDGETVRYIERFDPDFRVTFDAEDKSKYWYLDCARRFTSESKVTTVSGLDHLEGNTVGILGDGANQPTRVVTDGSITLQESAKNVLVGLSYTSTVRSMNLNIPSADTMQGRKIRIHRMVARFHKSLSCKFASNGSDWDEIFFRDHDDFMDSSPKVFTGDKEVRTGADYETQQAISLRQDRPFPLCVLAQILWVNFYGD